MSSSVSYQKTFPKYPRVNISITSALSQNNNTKTANLTLPTFQGNMERVFPFGKKDAPKRNYSKYKFSANNLSRKQNTDHKRKNFLKRCLKMLLQE